MKQRPAFTLADAILGLGVLAVTVLLIQLAINLLNRQTNLSLGSETTWYQAINLLESDRYDFELGMISTYRVHFVDKAGRRFYLQREKDSQAPLALRGVDGGYLPLVFHVQHDSFQWRKLNDHEIYLTVTTNDHRRHEAIVQLKAPRQCTTDGDSNPNVSHECNSFQFDIFGSAKRD